MSCSQSPWLSSCSPTVWSSSGSSPCLMRTGGGPPPGGSRAASSEVQVRRLWSCRARALPRGTRPAPPRRGEVAGWRKGAYGVVVAAALLKRADARVSAPPGSARCSERTGGAGVAGDRDVIQVWGKTKRIGTDGVRWKKSQEQNNPLPQ